MGSSGGGRGGPKLRFCPESNDLLYPKEDKERKRLVYVCRSCQYREDADPSDWCVYRNEVHHTSKEKSVVLQVGAGWCGVDAGWCSRWVQGAAGGRKEHLWTAAPGHTSCGGGSACVHSQAVQQRAQKGMVRRWLLQQVGP